MIQSQYRLATSGQILKKEITDPINTTWFIKGNNLRDFAFIISDEYNVQSSQKDNIHIYSYYLQNDNIGRYVVEFAEKAIEVFDELFGKYEYPTITIAESDFYIGGMEYPNLVFINTALYNEDTLEALEEVVVHEIAHQWWYNMVGNNQIEEAWIDEGLTQYSVALYYEKTYGIERYKSFLNESEIYCKVVFDILKDNNISFKKNIERKVTDFEHWILYDAITYDISALMLDDLREKIGEELFFKGIKYYFEENKFKISTKSNFINCMKKATNKNIEGIITPWLSGNVYWG